MSFLGFFSKKSPTLSIRRPITRLLPLISLVPALSLLAQDGYLQGVYSDHSARQKQLFGSSAGSESSSDGESAKESGGITDKLKFSLAGGIRYDSNIYLTAEDEVDDVIFALVPTLTYASGEQGRSENFYSLSYTPTALVYASETDRNTINHNALFVFGRQLPKSQMGFTLGYEDETSSDRFVSGTTERKTLLSTLNYSYDLSGKTRLDAALAASRDKYDREGLFDKRQYDIRLSALYQATGKLMIGPSFKYAYSNFTGTSDQSETEVGVKLEYQATGKTRITGTVGYNVYEVKDSFSSKEKNMSWELGLQYQPSAKTQLRTTLYRTPRPSYTSANSAFLATGLSVGVDYEMAANANAFVLFAYENDDYYDDGPRGSQDTDYFISSIGGNYNMSNGIELSADMTYRTNQADLATRDFDNFSVGINASYNF
jgi:hypothetical protein